MHASTKQIAHLQDIPAHTTHIALQELPRILLGVKHKQKLSARMDSEKRGLKEGSTFDFLSERKWLIFLIGYADSPSILYQMYRAVLMTICLFNYCMSAVAAKLVPGVELTILCLHTCVIALAYFWAMSARILTTKSLNASRVMINSGIYLYEEEEDETEMQMRLSAVQLIKKRCRLIATTYGVLGSYALVLLPLSQYFLSSDDDVDMSEGVLNKYYPYPIYMPFDTFTPLGFIFGMLFNAHYVVSAFGNGVVYTQIYLSCSIQMQAQLKILNHSLRNIQRRAYSLFVKAGYVDGETFHEDLYNNKIFQNCMYASLRANVRHHQALLSFHKKYQPCVGSSFLMTAVLGAFSYACMVFLILQEPPMNMLMIYLVTLLGEFVYNHFMCHIGQQLLDESSALFESLFSTPWFSCDKRFNTLLAIMMCYTLRPIEVKALLLNVTANVKAHGDLISAMYKLTNVVR